MTIDSPTAPRDAIDDLDPALREQVASCDFFSGKSRKSARLSSALLDYKRPEGLNLIPLGTSWSVDLCARLNNGIRRELIDLYNMIDSMQRRIEELRSLDLWLFFRWWDVFASYLETVVRATNTILIPWAYANEAPPRALDEDVRRAVGAKVKEMLATFKLVMEHLPRRPPDESLAKIIKALTHIHPVFEFIESVESLLPESIEANYEPKFGTRMERKLAKYMNKTGNTDLRRMHICILERGMTDEMISAWSRRISPLVRAASWAMRAKFRNEHLCVVSKLATVAE